MNAPAAKIDLPAVIGAAIEGGFFLGVIMLPDGPHGLVKAPRAHELADVAWGPYVDIPGALSLVDGRANTLAMAAAGSELAKRILELRIDGRDDWYLPALDELEVAYRAAKPTDQSNSAYYRSGINLHAIPPTLPYAAQDPAQTAVEIFRTGGAEAFADDWYWTSTAHADSACAWGQTFGNGGQYDWYRSYEHRACPVRRFKI